MAYAGGRLVEEEEARRAQDSERSEQERAVSSPVCDRGGNREGENGLWTQWILKLTDCR